MSRLTPATEPDNKGEQVPATREQAVITLDTALNLVRYAMNEAERLGVLISVTIVDPSMNLIAFAKADGATPHSEYSSRCKANTAASIRRPTGSLSDELALSLPLATGLKLTNIIGGSPLVFNGTVAGAIGVAGGTPDQDAEVAAGAAAHTNEL
jgi:glc operon protein GlcG